MPPTIGGHVTHHAAGCAGRYGLEIHAFPIDAGHYTVDLPGLRAQARELRPALITIGGSLNLAPHPVGKVREIADEVGALVLFDAAHLCGLIAGRAWPNPLEQGAHLMTMSTYKSLGGPPGGLVVGTDASIAERIDGLDDKPFVQVADAVAVDDGGADPAATVAATGVGSRHGSNSRDPCLRTRVRMRSTVSYS